MPEGLNEKKLGAVIVLLIASIAPAMALSSYVAYALTPPNYEPIMESLAIRNQQIIENPTNLNMSISALNCGGQSIPVKAIKLGQIAESCSPGVAVSVNGTHVDCTASPLFVIHPGDTAIVNMILLYTSYPHALSTLHNAKAVSITVQTDEAMFYVECNCTGS